MGRLAASYLLSRDRRFCLRFRIPADLRHRFGRDEMVRAVGTADPRAARVIAARLAIKLSRLWAMARRQPDLGEDALRRLANDWLEAEIEREWALFDTGEFGSGMLEGITDRDEARRLSARLGHDDAWHTEHALLDTLPEEVGRIMAPEARALLAGQGKVGSPSAPRRRTHSSRRNSRRCSPVRCSRAAAAITAATTRARSSSPTGCSGRR